MMDQQGAGGTDIKRNKVCRQLLKDEVYGTLRATVLESTTT